MSEIIEKIKTLNEQFPVILSDYKRNYELYYNDNKDQTKINAYNTSISQVVKCIRDMSHITVLLEAQNHEFVEVLMLLNLLIAYEKTKNTKLKDYITMVKNVNNGSTTLISDYKENYNETNMRNWAMFIGILAICISFLKIFIIPDSAEAMLLIRDKKINETKALVDKLLLLATSSNTKRLVLEAREKKQKTELELQKRIQSEALKLEAAARAKINVENSSKRNKNILQQQTNKGTDSNLKKTTTE